MGRLKYRREEYYELKISKLIRKLPIIQISDNLEIASFVMLGDTELNYRCALEMINRFPKNDFDYLLVPEAKAIPLAQSICQLLSKKEYKNYVVLRKSVKSYMRDPLIKEVQSITTKEKQKMVLDRKDAEKIKGKGVYLLDDVVSTGSSYKAMTELVSESGARIEFAGAVLREGNFDLSGIEKKLGFRIEFLGNLPIFRI